MDLVKALLEVHKGNKVSCRVWEHDGYHLAKGEHSEPIFWNGKKYEPVEAGCLAGWIYVDRYFTDWYVLPDMETENAKT